MAWLKSKEQKQKEREAEEAARAEERREYEAKKYRNNILSQVIITPENLESYQRRVGYAVGVIDTGERNKGVTFKREYSDTDYELLSSDQLKKLLAETGIEAIVETSYSFYKDNHSFYICEFFYGLPVARKKSQGPPYR